MRKELFEQLVRSVKDGGAILRGEKAPARASRSIEVEAKKVREAQNLTQVQFAAMMGISVATLRNWEQGRRKPEGPARILLQVMAKHPEAIYDSRMEEVDPEEARKENRKRYLQKKKALRRSAA